ncbi:ABC transporter ATP-binding protein [Peribacillus frigoritolerans]|uniref:ABC transporter ATP-binding protein n=1 Tax=Peribacillus frigoritolerans TaxID=450367 RepID=UPI00105A3B6E|nr:ABC transporter ATP-binding protein [Peribacillus frigoritolerans]TDL76084.1 ABC transporter ATP-binding protein [Peribacillus frigoritolerans]
MDVLHVKELSKIYKGKVSHEALTDIDLTIGKGEIVGVMGPSGSGKTTLLNVISTIDSPTTGSVWIEGEQPHLLDAEQLALFRRRKLGFVFQFFNLLNTLSVAENMALPLALDGVNPDEIGERVEQMAERLGIQAILNKRTYEISGGQAQRTAVGRALIHRPALILADEPTGNLDSKAARDVMDLLTELNKKQGTTMMLVTHDAKAASYCDRVIFIKDGKLYNEIHAGDKRTVFYQNIINVLSLLGGHRYDLS